MRKAGGEGRGAGHGPSDLREPEIAWQHSTLHRVGSVDRPEVRQPKVATMPAAIIRVSWVSNVAPSTRVEATIIRSAGSR